MTAAPLITVVDDDQSVRTSAVNLLEAIGFRVHSYGRAETFLRSKFLLETACLILDVRMPGLSGLELHQKLRTQGIRIPTIFVSAQIKDHMRAAGLPGGAVDYLEKPVSDGSLLASIHKALNLAPAL